LKVGRNIIGGLKDTAGNPIGRIEEAGMVIGVCLDGKTQRNDQQQKIKQQVLISYYKVDDLLHSIPIFLQNIFWQCPEYVEFVGSFGVMFL